MNRGAGKTKCQRTLDCGRFCPSARKLLVFYYRFNVPIPKRTGRDITTIAALPGDMESGRSARATVGRFLGSDELLKVAQNVDIQEMDLDSTP